MRELKELEPLNDPIGENMWYRHLSKRFLHEEILTKLSENRDFILSLNKDICYNGIQMWMHFHRAEKTTDDKLSKYHANEWLNYLKSFTISVKYPMTTELHKKWDKVVKEYFSEVES